MADTARKPTPSANPDPARPGGDDAYAAMIARAEALLPRLRERAPRTEELRRLPPETERDLHDAGLFRILQPKRIGGIACMPGQRTDQQSTQADAERQRELA